MLLFESHLCKREKTAFRRADDRLPAARRTRAKHKNRKIRCTHPDTRILSPAGLLVSGRFFGAKTAFWRGGGAHINIFLPHVFWYAVQKRDLKNNRKDIKTPYTQRL